MREAAEERMEEDRRRSGGDTYLLLCARVLMATYHECVVVIYKRVFKRYPLEPMQFQGGYVIQMLKPMHSNSK